MIVGTDEWVEKYIEALNNNASYEDAAKTWEGDFVFIIKEIPLTEKNVDNEETIVFYLDLWHGKCRKGHKCPIDQPPKSVFVVTGKYPNWKKVFTKQLDPIQALMQGKLKLTGDMGKVMRAVKAAQELVETIQTIDTEYMDD